MPTMLVLQAAVHTAAEQTINSPIQAFFLIGILIIAGLCVGLGLAWIYARAFRKKA